MKRKILYISMCMPLDKAFHAGGKTFNYYINKFVEDEKNEVTLIAKVLQEEEQFISHVNPKIRSFLVATPKEKLKRWIAYLKSINSKFNPCYKYGNVLTKEIYDQIEMNLRRLKNEGYQPGIVILEWTSMLLFIECVKKYFPNAKYVASEHDVTFLGKQREVCKTTNPVNKLLRHLCFLNMKKRELAAINKCDLVVTHNHKDKNLLINNGIVQSKLDVISPFYERFNEFERKPNNQDILFYGAMNRIENSSSALWFIDNVLPKLADCDVRFIILGNKPPKDLLQLRNDKIIVTGFVDDITPYFSSAMCLVAPLLLGAGVKVKVIEALSSGIPVLTNDIGIEGIDAKSGEEYIHCDSPEDYENAIRSMIMSSLDIDKISKNAKKLISCMYDLEASFVNYSEKVYGLIK